MDAMHFFLNGGVIRVFRMSGLNRVVATCWTCLLLAAFLCEPVLSKGGRGGSRGSSRGTHSRSSSAGSQRGSGPYGGTHSRVRAAGRSSPVRVAAAAAAGAAVAVALSADKWYASAYRRSNADSSEDVDYYNRTNYFDSQMSGSTKNGYSLPQLVSIIIATFSQKYGFFQDSIL
ncbi:shadow of prion protein isoform X1 [Notothenia coriiceps]|uniref:Shadow of prion protein n=2 Tax=Notothenia coriiceps TaxID=8208 RepID=A0A6I9PR79_9TELE|nr:PREDICTED: shadow of prion protein isoform X1 [Notothenia coriiceps]